MNDSLKELAQSEIKIKSEDSASVLFMDEPGEHKLVLSKNVESKIYYELRWYSKWASWNLTSEENFDTILKGETTIPNYRNEVRNVLIKIMTEIGPILYKEKWKEHDFPILEYNTIK